MYSTTLWSMFMFKAFVEQAEIKHVSGQSVELDPVLGSHKAIQNALYRHRAVLHSHQAGSSALAALQGRSKKVAV